MVTFDVGAAARQQKRAELHHAQHGGKSCAPIAVTSHVSLERDASVIVCFCASFISAVAPVAVGREIRDGVTRFPVLPASEGEDPLKIIRCVIATRDLKDFRSADRTSQAFLEALLPKPAC